MMNSGARRFALQKIGFAITMMIVVTVLMREAVTSLQVRMFPLLSSNNLYGNQCYKYRLTAYSEANRGK